MKSLVPLDVMRFLSEYIEGIDKIVPDSELSEATKIKLRKFYADFVEHIKSYYRKEQARSEGVIR